MDYLADNRRVFMLSQWEMQVKRKADAIGSRFQIGNPWGPVCPAAAMSAKSAALSQRTREGQGTRFCVVKAWASPAGRHEFSWQLKEVKAAPPRRGSLAGAQCFKAAELQFFA